MVEVKDDVIIWLASCVSGVVARTEGIQSDKDILLIWVVHVDQIVA